MDRYQVVLTRKEHKEEMSKPVLSKDEIKRIQEEKASNANIKTYSFFGYQPANATYSNAKSISDDNPVTTELAYFSENGLQLSRVV